MLACGASPLDFNAAHTGLELAQRVSAEAVALYVIGTDITELPARARGEDILAQHRRAGEEILLKVSDEGARLGVRVKAVLAEGAVAEEILETARSEQCDLIVMGANNHNLLTRLLLGDTTGSVLRHAPCPVLVFPLQSEPIRPSEQAAPAFINPGPAPA